MADTNTPNEGPPPDASAEGWQAAASSARSGGAHPPIGEALRGIRWFRQLSVRVRRAGVTIHVDPNGVPATEEPADFILLTHPHFDVFSERDIDRVRNADTVVIAPTSMKKLVPDGDHYMSPGDALHVGGVDLLATPAYNMSRRYHPKSAGWLGYLFGVDGMTFYHAGHTSRIPSMGRIRCDVAFLPCDGKYSMGPTEMLQAAQACQARVVVPVHCGAVPGARAELERARASFPGEVVLLDPASPHSSRH